MAVPDDPDTRLTRDATAAALTEAGFPVAPATLATKATRGGGPIYRVFSGRAIYRWSDLIAWAEAQTSPPRHSTSEIKPTHSTAAGEQAHRTSRNSAIS